MVGKKRLITLTHQFMLHFNWLVSRRSRRISDVVGLLSRAIFVHKTFEKAIAVYDSIQLKSLVVGPPVQSYDKISQFFHDSHLVYDNLKSQNEYVA